MDKPTLLKILNQTCKIGEFKMQGSIITYDIDFGDHCSADILLDTFYAVSDIIYDVLPDNFYIRDSFGTNGHTYFNVITDTD